MEDRSATHHAGTSRIDAPHDRRVARYIALERQKQQLRRERDSLLIGIARDAGERGLADRLQVAQDVALRMLADARGRTRSQASDEAGAAPRPAVAAGDARGAQADGRWAEADMYYAALGRGEPTLFARRPARRG